MNKEFLTYKLSLELKELGFDEPCIGTWRKHACSGNPFEYNIDYCTKVELDHGLCPKNSEYKNDWITAILWSQAFRFFRDIHGLYIHSVPEFYYTGINFNWQILWYLPKEQWTKYSCNGGTFLYGDNGEYPTQEAADIAMIEKMIEIVKNKMIVNLVQTLK